MIDSVKGLKIVHLNIRSLFLKMDLLRSWVSFYKPHVITISETWLSGNITDEQIQINDYILFRSDRSNRRGGGVATYVSTKLKPLLISAQVDSEDIDCLFVQLNLHLNKKLTIGNFYRAPSASADSARAILATINSLSCPTELIILGDFNWNWNSPASSNEKKLFESIHLTQLITEPTRVTDTTSTLLDLIFVSHPNRITKSGVLPDCFSDHCVIYCVWKINLPRLPPKLINIRQSKQINIENFIQDVVSIDWDRFQLIPFVNEAWSFFLEEFTKVIDKHAPWKSVRVKGRHLPWINSDLISLFRRRDNAWAKYRASKEQADWDTYKQLRNFCKTQTRNAEANYYRNSLCQDFKNPKQFWKRLNNILRPLKAQLIKFNLITRWSRTQFVFLIYLINISLILVITTLLFHLTLKLLPAIRLFLVLSHLEKCCHLKSLGLFLI